MSQRQDTLSSPRVSIVIPVYNGSNYLAEAIDSALAQTYENIEVVVVNDGSTDNGATEAIAKSYGNKISYYAKVNGGVATALNYGIEKMKGDYFSWLSHDDLYEKSKVAEQIAYIKQSGKPNTIVSCNASVLFASGVKKKTYIDSETFAFIDIFLATSAVVGVNGCSLLIPRDALLRSGGFDKNLPVTQDYDLWFRLTRDCEFHLLEKHLIISRRHEEQDSVKKQQLCYVAAEELHYGFLSQIPYERFEEMFNSRPVTLESFHKNYNVYKAGGYRKTASMMLKYLIRYYADRDLAKQKELLLSEVGREATSDSLLYRNKTKPRVMFFSNVWHRGGIEHVLSYIFGGLGDGYEFFLVTNEDNSDKNVGYPISKNVRHIKVANRDQLAEIANIISAFDIDVFVGNPNFLASFIDIYPLLEGMKVKSVAYNHGHFLLPYMIGEALYPTAIKIKASYGAADRVIWLSKVASTFYSINNDNGLYIPNPIVVDSRAKPKKVPGKNILAVGRFDDAIKQIDKILLVFKELYELDSEYHLTIVGHCPMDIVLVDREGVTLAEFVAQKNIPLDNISFEGERKNTAPYYEKADFLLLTSKCEGFALVLIEAMAKGVPCAALQYVGIEEIIQHGNNGWVRQQDGHSRLAKDIHATLSNPKLYASMSRSAFESVGEFNMDIFIERWSALLSSLTHPAKRNGALLRSKFSLPSETYETAILEYERLLNSAVEKCLSKPQIIEVPVKLPASDTMMTKTKKIAARMKQSIREDGLYITGEKVVRKVYSKVRRR